jgi:amino acid adenylation domain-containing protein
LSRLDEMLDRLPPEKRALLELRLARESGKGSAPEQIIQPRDPAVPAALSYAQQRLWFLHRLGADGGQYNVTRAVRISGPLDRPTLAKALSDLVERQAVLRTTYQLSDGTAYQRVEPPEPVPIPCTDLTALEGAARQSALQKHLRVEAAREFDLVGGLMVRAHLYRLEAQDHILLLVIHHVASDAWSMDVALRELAALYAAAATECPAALGELPFQYADYAAWERQRLDGADPDEALAYWKTQLENLPILDLPTDRPRPAMPSHHGGQVAISLPPSLTDNLRALAQASGTTLYMALLTLFSVLLSRYSRQDDIVIGSPVAGRNHPGTEGLIGAFINTLVMRCPLAGDPSFREALLAVRETVLQAFSHQEIPFERLVQVLNPDRDPSRHPLTQIMMVLHNTPTSKIEIAGLSFTPVAFESHSAKFDLTLDLQETANGLQGSFEYASDLFERETIERLGGHLATLAAAVTSDPDLPISKLPLLGAAERQRLLVDWNATARDFDRELTLDEAIRRQCLATPDKTAVVFGDQRLSYADLDARATELGCFLQQAGVAAETPVGICLHRSTDMVVALLGVMKAGTCYVPLDPSFPRERLHHMLEDSGARVLLTETELVDWITPEPHGPNSISERVCLDRDWNRIASAGGPLEPRARPDSVVYTIYTSGSTGRPKGVRIPHRAVINFLDSMRREPGLTASDRLLSVTTLSFDIAVLELFLPLTTGAQVILVSREVAYDGYRLAAEIEAHGVTVMQATPATWRMLLEAGWQGSPTIKVLCGGEALPPDLAEQLRRRVASLWNVYGPTETTVWSTAAQIESLEGGVTVGRPIANTQVYLLDGHGQPVPIGVPGELYIAGDGLAHGYLNRAQLTEERFPPNPFSDRPGARMYATGDLARYKADGRIEVLGRMDLQVKIRGFRIELGEIETALNTLPGVANAVVVAQPDPSAGHRLVAHVVPGDGDKPPAVMDMRNALLERLPDYMVPSYFAHADELPLTPNGKTDRLALPTVDRSQLVTETAYRAPETAVEEDLARICADLLGLERVSIDSNFFAIGGHSLLGTQFAMRIRAASGVDVPLRVFFERPSLRELARYIEESGQSRVAPTDSERVVAGIWADVLGVESVPLDTDFFELGGDYQQATRLLSEIESRLDTRLPLSKLFETPTVRGLAATLGRDDWGTQWKSLVAVSPGGHRRPFFCIHGDPSALADHMDADQPYYWLHHAQDGSLVGFATVEEIAADHLKEIRAAQPRGPYLLGGFSFGGVLAFEITRKLREAGERVDMLALFDPPRPPPPRNHPAHARAGGQRRKPPLRRVMGVIRLRVRRLKGLLQHLWGNLRISLAVASGKPLPADLRIQYLVRIFDRASRQYHYDPVPGSATVFVHDGGYPTDNSLTRLKDTWESVTEDPVEVRVIADVPTHADLFREPYVGRLGAELNGLIEASQGSHRGSAR